MPKKVEQCVQDLLADPNFQPLKGKSKVDSAWAVCVAHSKQHEKECMLCDIEDGVLFKEALNKIVKEIEDSKDELFVEKVVQRGDKWCVIHCHGPEKGKAIKCFDTKAEADAMHRAIQAHKNSMEESYLLEGINVSLFNETVSDKDLANINKFTVKPVEAKDIVIYTALLIDDKITRNNTLYNKDFQSMLLSLPAGEGNFIGSPILFGDGKDHQHTASAQVGRIFDAWQVLSKEKNYGVMAKIYLLKETNEDLINKIDSGVLKEMSISTKVELPICSICGQNVTTCDHTPGKDNCYVIMSGRGFVAEASFVAVPGSNSAKILNEDETKKYLRLENLKDLVAPMIAESITAIPTIPMSMIDAINAELKLAKENYDKMIISLDEINKKFKESETTVYPLDMSSILTDIKTVFIENKAFVVRVLSKYNIPAAEFGTDPIPEITQGLKDVNVPLLVKLLFDNIEVLGINLSKIEKFLKFTPEPTNPTYTGDINDMVNLVRFLNKKMDNIKTRIYKLQGRFDLELEERNTLIQETIKFGVLCGKFGFHDKTLSEKFFEGFNTDEIKTLKEKFFKEGSAIYTPEVTVEKPKDEPEPKKEETKASPREIAKKIVNGGKSNG